MKYKMNRSEFCERLNGEGYSLFELSHLFKVVSEMDSRVRRWTIRWLLGMGYPNDSIEGVTVRMLVDEGHKPMSAFIIMDWLIKDPETAKYSLVRKSPNIGIDEKSAQELRAILQSEGLLTSEESNEAQPGDPDTFLEY